MLFFGSVAAQCTFNVSQPQVRKSFVEQLEGCNTTKIDENRLLWRAHLCIPFCFQCWGHKDWNMIMLLCRFRFTLRRLGCWWRSSVLHSAGDKARGSHQPRAFQRNFGTCTTKNEIRLSSHGIDVGARFKLMNARCVCDLMIYAFFEPNLFTEMLVFELGVVGLSLTFRWPCPQLISLHEHVRFADAKFTWPKPNWRRCRWCQSQIFGQFF